ncbi:MAG: VOC family protein [Actinobacteria bacterium]|nr:MAG: VOC family protein [Actinomycetota bacterium]
MARPIHFEIHASEPERLINFYTELFGWRIERWGEMPYWNVSTGPDDSGEVGIDGGLLPREGPAPAAGAPLNAMPITVGVDDCAATLARAVELGGSQSMGVSPIPGIGWLAYIIDPDGNKFGIMQPDDSATL